MYVTSVYQYTAEIMAVHFAGRTVLGIAVVSLELMPKIQRLRKASKTVTPWFGKR